MNGLSLELAYVIDVNPRDKGERQGSELRHDGQGVRDYVPPTCLAPKGYALGTRKRSAGRHKGEG